jgi:hypothetical protein
MVVSTFLRNFNVMPDGCVDFFLGSGASAQAGIPTGSGLVCEFKREIYCSETEISKDQFKDLQSQATRKRLQEHFDNQGNHPVSNDPSEYSHYFELCYSTSVAREQFILNKVRDIAPSLGHLCLAELFITKKIQCIWTTNFDELIESGIKTICPEHSFNVFSSVNSDGIEHSILGCLSSIYKLHGDYRYDKIKNTSVELQSLEVSMYNQFGKNLYEKGLIFVGYSGCDESIMHILESHIEEKSFLKYGLIWLVPAESIVSTRVLELMEKACLINESSCIIEISNFDEFMYCAYKVRNKGNSLIDDRWFNYPKRKSQLSFIGKHIDSFVKTNSFISLKFPFYNVFETDITTWAELKEIIGQSNIIAALYNGQIYCFEDEGTIRKVFLSHVLSEIREEEPSNKILSRNNSVYIGMLYELIRVSLSNELNLKSFGRNRYFDPNKFIIENQNKLYEGFEVSLSFYEGKFFLSIVLTIHFECLNGKAVDKLQKQKIINQRMSLIYNSQYDEKLKDLNKKLKRNKNIVSFEYKDFVLNFNGIFVSCGGFDRKEEWPSLPAYQYDEPEMLFDINCNSHVTINQLKGITKYGPIDYSYSIKKPIRAPIKIVVVSPKRQLEKILTHLSSLNQQSSPRNLKDGFLQLYNGFDLIYKKGIQIPSESDSSHVFTYDEKTALTLDTNGFLNLMKGFVDKIAIQTDFDISVIYIPAIFKNFRENSNMSDDFNLHDALKLYATDKNVKLQFIEEKSINSSDPCKVLWGLSTSLYAKASGALWQPKDINDSTAFVGVGYAQSEKKGICVGCSQLFDSSGTGLRLLLRKIDNPKFYGKNPFMGEDDARTMMSSLREQYYKCDPTVRLNRIVVHKTTFFTREEITGFTQALEGVEDIELLQIQEVCPWRAIRFGKMAKDGPQNFAIKRGTTIKLNSDTFLLWTHGCVIHPELKDKLNYYKGGRGIPAPLLIKRFYGKASGDTLAKEILMLSKMNWNSGDNLYKQLPVTLDFAKVLSRMSKQNEAIYNKAYDFRYFM